MDSGGSSGKDLEAEIEIRAPKPEIPAGMMFWQLVAGILGAGTLTYLATIGWLLISGVDPSCGTAAAEGSERPSPFADLAGLSDCLSALRGMPEWVLGIGGLAVGSMFGVMLVGFIGRVKSDFLIAILIPIVLLAVLRLVFDDDLLNLRLMMYHLATGNMNWELLRACMIASAGTTLGYYVWRK